MYLRDLAIELSDLTILPKGYTARQFHDSTHDVVEAYLDALGRRKVRLADAANIIVRVGPRPDVGIGSEAEFVVYPDGVAFVWLAGMGLDVNLASYVTSDRATRQKMLLTMLTSALLAVASRSGDDATPLERAKQSLLAKTFPLPEIPEKELRRRWGLLPQRASKRKPAGKRSNGMKRGGKGK
jgi:hypothetical protein